MPQGAEYRSVLQGLKDTTSSPDAIAIPMGPEAVDRTLQTWPVAPDGGGILLVGLCGSLSAELGVGDVVLYSECLDLQAQGRVWSCDRPLTESLQQRLQNPVRVVRAATSDRLIHRAATKRQLQTCYGADVVDMEGAAVLAHLGKNQPVAMLRVVSDDCDGDLPDLAMAMGADGSLKPLPMLGCFLRQPVAAARLIRGSLKGLGVLQRAIAELFGPS